MVLIPVTVAVMVRTGGCEVRAIDRLLIEPEYRPKAKNLKC